MCLLLIYQDLGYTCPVCKTHIFVLLLVKASCVCVETTEDKKEGSFKNNKLFVVWFMVFGEDGGRQLCASPPPVAAGSRTGARRWLA